MYKVIIDTCSFQHLGLNFDKSNTIINSLVKHSKNNIEIIMISVVRNEIISHINELINKGTKSILV